MPDSLTAAAFVDRPRAARYARGMDARTEQILLAQARNGNDSGFGQLVEANSAFALNLALRLVGHRQEAEDIAQEAFLRLHRALPGFRGDSRISTWLYRTISRLAVDHLRRERLKRRIFFFRSADADPDDPDPLDRAPAATASPEAELLQREAGGKLQRALDKLSPRQRAVFALRHFEGLPLKEIATVLGLEEGTVKAHLHRAVTLLRNELEEYRP